MKCLDVIGEPYVGTYYQQISFKAKTTDCRYSYTFTKIDQSSSLNFNFVVWPKRDPPVEGKLVDLSKLDWAVTNSFELQKDELITFRAIEKQTGGFTWEKPEI